MHIAEDLQAGRRLHRRLGIALQAVYAELLRQSFNTYTAVRGTAVSAVMSACKRYPCLAPLGLIIAIRAIAKLPQLTESDLSAWLGSDYAGAAVYDKLQAEVFASRGLPSLPAPTAQSAAGTSSLLTLLGLTSSLGLAGLTMWGARISAAFPGVAHAMLSRV